MQSQLIEEQVDISKLPDRLLTHENNGSITIGDLHANAMKFMFMLAKHGIATNITTEDYAELVTIYQKPVTELTKALLDNFDRILSNTTFNPGLMVRLIGDELADRGSNDYFILKIFEKLHQSGVQVETLISNHGVEFIEAYETQDIFYPPRLHPVAHAPSITNLQQLVQRKILSRDEILSMVNSSYKSTLRVISYSLSKNKNEITIYSHAPIGLSIIKKLAEKLHVAYQDATVSLLAATIDRVNMAFQTHVSENFVHRLYEASILQAAYSSRFDLRNYPMEYIMWNRLYEGIDRPDKHSDYQIKFVHGHDSSYTIKEKHIINLDNILGHSMLRTPNEGQYTILYSQEWRKVPVERTEASVPNSSRSPIISQALSNQLIAIEEQLANLEAKAAYLQKNGHTNAANQATTLHQTIKNQCESLWQNPEAIEQFKQNCLNAIELARPELAKHSGWEKILHILGNLILAVVGVGVLYVAAVLVNKAVNGNFLFFSKTDAADKLDNLEAAIKTIVPNT